MEGKNKFLFFRFFVVSLILTCFFPIEVQTRTFNVWPPGICENHNDEENVYCSIQDAIDASNIFDEIIVHNGTYYERIDFKGKAIIVRSENGADVTTINGDTDRDGTGDGVVVTFNTRESSASKLTGFTITNGTGFPIEYPINIAGVDSDDQPCTINLADLTTPEDPSEVYTYYYGGGIYCNQSSPTIENCIVGNNEAQYGGGIYLNESSATITDCEILNNTARRDEWTELVVEGNNPSERCELLPNEIFGHGGDGGGIYVWQSPSATITNCYIGITREGAENGNYAGFGGGGISLYASSSSIKDSFISNNTAVWGGGGIQCDYSSPSIENCHVKENYAEWKGGGILIWALSSPLIENCHISGNEATYGGGIHCSESDAT